MLFIKLNIITVCQDPAPSNDSQLAHLPQLCVLHSECGEIFPGCGSCISSCTMRLLCNDVAPKRVIVDFVTGVWWIAGGLHLASDHNVPREQPHLCPHINPTVLLTKVVKPERVEMGLGNVFKKFHLSLPLTLQLETSHLSTKTSSALLTPSVEAITNLSPRFQLETSPNTW